MKGGKALSCERGLPFLWFLYPALTPAGCQLGHVPHGHEDGEGEEADDGGENDDEDGADGFGHFTHGVLDLFVIVGGEVLKHGLEIAGAFADGDHVDGQRREIACGAERFRDALA